MQGQKGDRHKSTRTSETCEDEDLPYRQRGWGKANRKNSSLTFSWVIECPKRTSTVDYRRFWSSNSYTNSPNHTTMVAVKNR